MFNLIFIPQGLKAMNPGKEFISSSKFISYLSGFFDVSDVFVYSYIVKILFRKETKLVVKSLYFKLIPLLLCIRLR